MRNLRKPKQETLHIQSFDKEKKTSRKTYTPTQPKEKDTLEKGSGLVLFLNSCKS